MLFGMLLVCEHEYSDHDTLTKLKVRVYVLTSTPHREGKYTLEIDGFQSSSPSQSESVFQ